MPERSVFSDKENHRQQEINKFSSQLFDTLSCVPELISEEVIGEHKPLKQALLGTVERFCRFSDFKKVDSTLKVRKVSHQDVLALHEGEDPGIYLDLTNSYQERAMVNIYGGLRAHDTLLDYKETSTLKRVNLDHVSRTNTIGTNPTVIGVDIYNTRLIRNVNVWFGISSAMASPERQSLRINLLNYSDDLLDLHLAYPLTYPPTLLSGIVPQLRKLINKLQQLRGSV